LCFAHQVLYASQSYIKQFLDAIKNVKFNDHVLICKGCQKKINLKQPLNLILQDYIIINKLDMEFLLMLNKVEECLIAP